MLDLIPYLIIGCGILQLPIWLDMLLPFLPATRLRTIIARSMKIILMSSMVFCVTYSAYLNVVVFIPATYPSSPLLSLFHHLLTLYLYLQLMSYYIAACTLEPSRPLPLAHEQQSGDEERQEQESTTTPARICSICNCYQYARVSHCHICNRCSELMDHHCPFTGQCVGLANFRHFYIWLCWGMFAMGYAMYMLWFSFNRCYLSKLYASYNKQEWNVANGLYCDTLGSSAFLFLPCAFGYFALIVLFIFESWLLYIDVTSVEFLRALIKGKVLLRRQQTCPAVQVHDSAGLTVEYMESQIAIQQRIVHCSKSFSLLLLDGHRWWRYLLPYAIWQIRQSNRKHMAVD